MDKVFAAWRSLQPREQLIGKILAAVLVMGLLSIFFSQVFSSLAQNQHTLRIKKNEFYYVLNQAERIEAFLSSQKLGLDQKNPSEFLLSKSSEFDLLSYRLVKENEQYNIYFSSSSLGNASHFLNKISTHPSISLTVISITPTSDNLQLKVTLDFK